MAAYANMVSVMSLTLDVNAETLSQILGNAILQLSPDVTITQQTQRAQIAIILHNRVNNQYFKTTVFVQTLLSKLDGKKTLKAILSENPKLQDWIDAEVTFWPLMSKLLEAGIVVSNIPVDYRKSLTDNKRKARQSRLALVIRPWFIKLPLVNPDNLLTRLNKLTYWLWTPVMAAIWVGLLLITGLSAVQEWASLQNYWEVRFFNVHNLFIVLVCYPILKGFHELAHGLTTKRWGGQVTQAGIALLFFVPVPFMDASASIAFEKKQRRIVVASAGIVAELFFASVAFWVWKYIDNIFLKDLCMNVMLIGAVSSVFFNGNPLLKYDGYHILCDLIEIPNLGLRAKSHCSYLYKKCILGIDHGNSSSTRGEALWLTGYGVCSGLYRMVLSFLIAFFMLGKYFYIGVLLGFWAFTTQVLLPSIKGIVALFRLGRRERRAVRVWSTTLLGAGVLMAALTLVPVFHTDATEGIVDLPGEHYLKANTSGFVEHIYVENGQSVVQGEPILRLRNDELVHTIQLLTYQIEETQLMLNAAMQDDSVEVALFRDELQNLKLELAERLSEQNHLELKAPTDGRIVWVAPFTKQSYFERGERIAAVSSDQYEATFVLSESEMYRWQRHNPQVSVRWSRAQDIEIHLVSLNLESQAVLTLPHPFLSSQFGGSHPVDLTDKSHTKSLFPHFVLRLRIKPERPLPAGARVTALLTYESAPLAARVLTHIRQALLKQTGV